jgi:hypothetical protein
MTARRLAGRLALGLGSGVLASVSGQAAALPAPTAAAPAVSSGGTRCAAACGLSDAPADRSLAAAGGDASPALMSGMMVCATCPAPCFDISTLRTNSR